MEEVKGEVRWRRTGRGGEGGQVEEVKGEVRWGRTGGGGEGRGQVEEDR